MATKAKTKVVDAATAVVTDDTNDFQFTNFLETKCVGFDLALSDGKGIPVGSSILMFALPGSGKTTLICDVLYRLLYQHKTKGLPFRIHYLDSENSLTLLACMGKDKRRPEARGLAEFITPYSEKGDNVYKPQQLIYHSNISTFKEVEEVFESCVEHPEEEFNKHINIIIIDSLTNLTSQTLMEAETSKADFGSDAKERYRLYKKWLAKLRLAGITLIMTSQVRQKQGATPYEDPNRPAVTEGDKHNMDVIMKLSKSTNSNIRGLKKVTQKTINGDIEWQDRCKLTLSTFKDGNTKSRIGRFPNVEILINYGSKVINAYTVLNMLKAHGFIKEINAKTASYTEELATFIGESASHLVNPSPMKDINTCVSMNTGKCIEFLKNKGKYTAIVGVEEESDDGLF